MIRFPLRRGDPVSVKLGLGEHNSYRGCNGPTKGFFKAKILKPLDETSLVRFEEKIAPDYTLETWGSFVELCPNISDDDRCFVDEVCNNQLTYLGL